MSPDPARGGLRPGESEEDRLDRNLGELLQELRVALPGVQVLFAFLLAVPFQSNFDQTTAFQRNVYFGTLILTAISTALLIAPTAYHRITFRHQQKNRLVRRGNRFALLGLAFLGLAMTGAIVLVTDYLYSSVTAALAGTFALLLVTALWFVTPLFGQDDRGP